MIERFLLDPWGANFEEEGTSRVLFLFALKIDYFKEVEVDNRKKF